jgi:hypothetical protein
VERLRPPEGDYPCHDRDRDPIGPCSGSHEAYGEGVPYAIPVHDGESGPSDADVSSRSRTANTQSSVPCWLKRHVDANITGHSWAGTSVYCDRRLGTVCAANWCLHPHHR